MPTSRQIAAQINAILEMAQRIPGPEAGEDYDRLNNDIQQLESLARETFQARLEPRLRPILTKLEYERPLSPEEHATLELIFIGTTKYYVASENDIEQWQNEVARLLQQLEKFQASDLDDIESLLRLQAICREAARVLPDLVFYFRERERLAQFKQTTSGPIDQETGQLLAELIRDMLASKQV